MQKSNQNEFRIEKVIKRKSDKIYVKWKGYDNLFDSWISQYFPKAFRNFGGNINVKVNPSSHASKANIKNISHVALKTNLASLKTEVHKLDIDKLLPVPVELSKLRNAVKS